MEILARPRLLVVDDHPENLLALRGILERLDVELVEAGSGREALRKLLLQDFALVMLDVVMPDVDGREVARLMRQRDRTRKTPVMFVTAADPGSEMPGEKASGGPVEYLHKPLDPEDVRRKVGGVLGRTTGQPA